MPNGNLGFHFYKEYYRDFTKDDWDEVIKEKSPKLCNNASNSLNNVNKKLTSYEYSKSVSDSFQWLKTVNNVKTFELTTTYPGLLLGSGYNHAAGNINEEFKIGFYFDYTTGLPVIPGSSIKGLIRSAFPNSTLTKHSKDYKEHKNQRFEYLKENKVIKELLIGTNDSVSAKEKKDKDNKKIDELENEIFITGRQREKTNVNVYDRDTFFDAYIIGTGNKDNCFLSDDYITPHKDNPYKNPIPLKFLKVLPDVVFCFSFRLFDGIIDKDKKLELFKNIICDLGIGAKTNVGYGQFE